MSPSNAARKLRKPSSNAARADALASYADAQFDTLLKKYTSIAIAVSGGADSMALTLLAAEWAQKNGITFTAYTVDHRMRPESSDEAQMVNAWLKSHGIAHKILTSHAEKPEVNRQEWARKLRYRLLLDACHAAGHTDLLLAHHRQDQIETYLLRKQRGSADYGLACMPVTAEREGVTLVRPFLGVPKKDLQAYLEYSGQIWVEDPSNQDINYARTKIRRMPLSIQAQARIEADILRCGAQRAALDANVEHFFQQHVQEKSNALVLAKKALFSAAEDVQFFVLWHSVSAVTGRDTPLRGSQVSSLLKRLAAGEQKTTLSGCLVTQDEANLIFSQELKAQIKGLRGQKNLEKPIEDRYVKPHLRKRNRVLITPFAYFKGPIFSA